MTDQPDLANRLRLAHQARRAKAAQLDDVRRALCDAGVMQDDDPYSHADLADVIRQAWPTVAMQAASPDAPGWDPITGDRTWDDVKDHQFTGLGDIVDVTCSRLDCPEPDAASTVLEGEDHAYRDAVNAPLRPETIAALKARFASGGLLPTRTPKPSARTTPDTPVTSGDAADNPAPGAHACGCSDPACDDAPCRYCKTCLDPKEPTP